jgi:hypothetical protein
MGPNKLLVDLFEKVWHAINKDLVEGIKESKLLGKILKDLNSRFIS